MSSRVDRPGSSDRMISKFDPSRFRRDLDARSLSLFCIEPMVHVDQQLIDMLVAESELNSRCNARICLHSSVDSDFHEMIILEREGFYYPPHRHAAKGESCHIIRGELAVFAFDDAGLVTRFRVLGRNGNVIFRVSAGQWHSVLPLSDPVIYHEAKPGPFLGTSDSEFASWAPKREDAQAVRVHLDVLRRLTESIKEVAFAPRTSA